MAGSKMSVWKNIFQLIVPRWRKFVLIVFIGLLATGANLVEPLIYREAINDVAGLFIQKAKDETRQQYQADADTAQVEADDSEIDFILSKIIPKEPHTRHEVAGRTPGQAIQTLLIAVVILFFVNLLGQLFLLLGENMNVRLSCSIEQGFIRSTFGHVLRLPLGFFSKRSSAGLAKQINQSEEVSGVVNGLSQEILPEIISLCGILAIMFWQNVTLTLIALAVIPFYLLIAWRSANKLETGLSSFYDRWEEVAARMQDALAGIKTVKLSGAEQREVARFSKISDEAYRDYVNRSKLANQYVFWENMLTRLSTALVLGYGGYLTLKRQLTPGDVVMFVAYLDRLYGPIDTLASLWVNLQQNIASIARAFRLVDHKHEEKRGVNWEIKQGKVEFKNVTFAYTKEREILKGLSFTIEPGKVTAIVGTSGAGKTTAVDLLMKLYEPSSGEIVIDGKELSAIDASSIRRQIGMVATDGAVFRGTLADNIRYKKPEASDEEVKRAAIAAGLESTLQRLPDGLLTKVGESGLGLSVGERQRIQIARILIAQPKILILDEATANLDFATEAEVKRTIKKVSKENTVIVIAHRYSMVKDADHVIVLSAGEVIEQGKPADLIVNGGWFAKFAHIVDGDKEVKEGYEEEVEDDEA
ncbi:MAG TPA: ABC transporter ATP-binding protein [Cyclobacteriaceae bacterium]|jgi:ABC-type multidrug transport system fused ATPase/permease subunit|nr:ABC transporter ATP-binding protein [Cyclobacteriaceae bacterium]